MLMKVKPSTWLAQALGKADREAFAIIADITPADAAFLLSRNDGNRYLRPALARQFADDMAGGRWEFNGQSVVVSDTGELNDGQHRLNAAIDADFTLRTVAVFGVPRDSRATLDTGKHRSASDYLTIAHGVKNAALSAAIARAVVAWDRRGRRSLEGVKHVSSAETVDRVLHDKALAASVSFAGRNNLAAHELASPSAFGFCHYVLGRISQSAAEAYLHRIIFETGGKGDAAWHVRRELVATTSRRRETHVAMILRGWNYMRRKEAVPPDAIHGRYPMEKLAS